MKKEYVVGIILVTLTQTSLVMSGEQDSKGVRGGDGCELEFKNLAKSGFVKLTKIHTHLSREQNTFNQITDQVKVNCDNEPLEIDGVKKTALSYINENPRKTELNINRWAIWPEEIKEAVATHEILTFIGLEDTSNYTYTQTLSEIVSEVDEKEVCANFAAMEYTLNKINNFTNHLHDATYNFDQVFAEVRISNNKISKTYPYFKSIKQIVPVGFELIMFESEKNGDSATFRKLLAFNFTRSFYADLPGQSVTKTSGWWIFKKRHYKFNTETKLTDVFCQE